MRCCDVIRSPRPRAQHRFGVVSRYVPDMAFHDIEMTSIAGDQVTFDEYRGRMALVVNVASA